MPGLTVNALPNNYRSSVLKLISKKASAPDFYHIHANSTNYGHSFSIRGDGYGEFHSLVVREDGLHVRSGGLHVAADQLNTIKVGIRRPSPTPYPIPYPYPY